uniref:Reverse transcriptase zinc-binding domain-containing protein n=1 Tax=Aegilops tauschii subsp. strangulata TaxID=200361 RepID=A0A453RN35_AEGTS
RWTESGHYSAKSYYEQLFVGSIRDPHWRPIWRSWAPTRVKIFLWLAALDRCWTAARLARHNLPHADSCLFCDQDTECIQ